MGRPYHSAADHRTMPVVLPAIANILDKTMQWRRLALPLLMIALGILVVNVELVTRLDVQASA